MYNKYLGKCTYSFLMGMLWGSQLERNNSFPRFPFPIVSVPYFIGIHLAY